MVARMMIVGTLVGLLAGCGGAGGGGVEVDDSQPASSGLPGRVELKTTSLTVAESSAAVAITIARLDGSAGTIDVAVAAASGSAIAGQDFATTSTTVRFADGDAVDKVVSVPVMNDAAPEASETFTVSLAVGGTTLPGTATVTIVDDDSPGLVRLAHAAYSVGEGGGSVDIEVMRVDGRAGSASVQLATRDGTALAAADYTATTTTVTFADGDAATKTVTIPILNDSGAEQDETFDVVLSSAAGASLDAPATATVTIPANDQPVPPPAGGQPGSIQLSSSSYTINESSGNAIVTVTRVGGTSGVVGATLTITPGTAVAGGDYGVAPTTVSFPDGAGTSQVVAIPIVNDGVAEFSESFSVALSSPTGGATIGAPAGATIAIQDNDPPNPPVVTISADTKRLDLSWPAVPTAITYRVFLNPDGASGFTQVGADLPAATTSASLDISVHTFNWPLALLRVEACNEALCSGSTSTSAFAAMLPAIGYFKAQSIDSTDLFGASVAVSGDGNTVAVGVAGEDSSATGVNGNSANNGTSGSGAVYVFARTAGVWSQQAYLKAANTALLNAFGAAVAVSNDGNTIAVGAPGRSSATGATYVFIRTGQTWSQQAMLTASNGESGDRFGGALALGADGSTLVVGANGEDGDGSASANNAQLEAGAAYVFGRAGSIWTQRAYLKASNAQAADLFGSAVAVNADGGTLAIGASAEASASTAINGDQNNNDAAGAGAAYVFTNNGVTWVQSAYIKAPNAEPLDNFGSAVALSSDGNTLAVGAPQEDGTDVGAQPFPIPPPPTPPPLPPPPLPPEIPDPPPTTFQGICAVPDLRPSIGCESGAVYVFVRGGSLWSAQSYIKGSNNQYEDRFGTSVALSVDGNTVAIGSLSEDSSAVGVEGNETLEDAPGSGAAYVYVRNEDDWSQRAYVKAPNTDADDTFGTTVSLSADAATLAIGASGEDSNSALDRNNDTVPAAGAAYLY